MDRHVLLPVSLALGLAMGHSVAAQDLGPPEGEAPAIGEFSNDAEDDGAGTAGAAEDEATGDEAETPPAGDEPEDEADGDEADGDEAQTPPAGEAEEAAPGDELIAPPMGIPDLEEPEVIEIVRDTFDDWEVRCAPDGDQCFLYQLAEDDEENPVAEFSLVTLPAGSEAVAGVTVVTPLGTLLPAGLTMQINGGEPLLYEFTFCSQVGCFARFGLTGETLGALQRGGVAQLTLVSIGAPDQPIELDVSLIGFTAAYESLDAPE